MGFFADFKASLMKGDVLTLATAVVIGGAFGKIVGSAVEDLIMPLVGLITGGIDFTTKFIALNGQHYDNLAAAKAAGAPVMTYGNFVQAVINFVIIALFIFIVLSQYLPYSSCHCYSDCSYFSRDLSKGCLSHCLQQSLTGPKPTLSQVPAPN